MKFIIGVDCDGVACVVGQPGRALSDSCDMSFARLQATREADAAARALLDNGAGEVIVWDNHGSGANLEFDLLDRRCRVALGSGFGRRWPGLDGTFAGVLMVGYHAMEGTSGGVLAHTYSPSAFRCVAVNGVEMGEIALDAAVAGAHGVPLIFVASDEAGCAEARRFVPSVETVATKQGVGCNAALGKHPAVVVEEIYQGVCRAVARRGEIKPFAIPPPAVVEIRFKHVYQALKARLRRSGWRLAGPWTIRKELASLAEWAC
jgi:D-amino peptidase